MSTGVKDEGGFSLIELLVVVSVLGIISFVLTEAFILGLKTTDGITADVSNSVAVQALRSHFTGDAQKAKEVIASPDTPDTCAKDDEGAARPVFLQLKWSEAGAARHVSYELDGGMPPAPGQAELVRWSCTGSSGAPDKRVLGYFEFSPGDKPVEALCSPPPPPPTAVPPCATVTMKILTNRAQNPAAPIELTVRRRIT